MKEFVFPSRLNKRLISTLMTCESTNPSKIPNFSLKSTSEFASRSGDIFGKLQTLEKNHEEWMSENSTLESFEETDNSVCGKSETDNSVCGKSETDNSVCGKSETDIFKKPLPTKLWKPKRSSASPFKRRPSKKWKKYSLKDVPITSDANNAAIAFQCISELRMRKEKTLDATDNADKKIVFAKPKQNEKNLCTYSSTRHTDGNAPALIQTALKEKKEGTQSPKIKLHHLQDDGCDSI